MIDELHRVCCWKDSSESMETAEIEEALTT